MNWFKLYCLREKGTNKLLNVAYSPDGLIWTTDNLGRNIAGQLVIESKGKQYRHSFNSTKQYNDAIHEYTTIDRAFWEWKDDVYVCEWEHQNHDTNKGGRIVAEIALKHKALALIYYSDYNPEYRSKLDRRNKPKGNPGY